jgi:hypothetical protein
VGTYKGLDKNKENIKISAKVYICMNGSSINHGLMKNIHTITTTRCIITQKGAVLIYFVVEAENQARIFTIFGSNEAS